MRFIASFFVLISVLFLSPAAIAQDYRDIGRRFTITPPPGWIRIPDADITKFDTFVADRIKDRNFHYIAGFTKNVKTPLEVPYVLIQETNVRLKGGNYNGLEESLRTIDLSQVSKDAAANLTDVVKDFRSDQWVVDKTHNRMMMNIHLTDARNQRVKGLCTAFFGEESIIQINCYAAGPKFDASLKDFDAFNEGFSYDPGAQFQPVRSFGVLSGAAKGAIIGISISIVWFIYKRLKGEE